MGHRVHIFFPKTDGERAVVEAMRREGTLAVGSAMTSALLGKPREADCDEEWVGDVDCEDGLGGDIEKAFNKDQPRDERGRFSHVGSAKASAELKRRYKPSDLVAGRIKDMTLWERQEAAHIAAGWNTIARQQDAETYQQAYDAGYKEAAKVRRKLLAQEYRHRKKLEKLSKASEDAMNKASEAHKAYEDAMDVHRLEYEKVHDPSSTAVLWDSWMASPARNKLHAEREKLQQASIAADNKRREFARSMNDRALAVLGISPDKRAGVSVKMATSSDVKEVKGILHKSYAKRVKSGNRKEQGTIAADAEKFLGSLLSVDAGNSVSSGIRVFGISKRHSPRAFSYDKNVFLSHHDDAGTAVHEMGHSLESDPKFAALARGFLHKRCGDEKPHVMRRDKVKGPEWGREDDFAKAFGDSAAYVGRHYNSSPNAPTEIFSMGLEKLYRDPVGFAKKDPEFFNFMVGAVHGHIKGKMSSPFATST